PCAPAGVPGRHGRPPGHRFLAPPLGAAGEGARIPEPRDPARAEVPGGLAGEGEGVRRARGHDERGGVPPPRLRPLLVTAHGSLSSRRRVQRPTPPAARGGCRRTRATGIPCGSPPRTRPAHPPCLGPLRG